MEQNKDQIGAAVVDVDAMTTTERDGYEAGIANKPDPNPYRDGSKFRIEWQSGFDTGRAECLSWDVAAVLGEAVAEMAATSAFRDAMPKRADFIAWAVKRGLDVSVKKDAWGAQIFVHDHIQAMWTGWFSAPTVSARAADALDSQPTVSAVLAELRADLRELANNTETFGEYSQEAARVALDSATDALDEVAAKYASSQPTDGGVRNDQLMRFYAVETVQALIDAQEQHIVKLQAKLPRDAQPAFTRAREG